MRKVFLVISCLALVAGAAFAQNVIKLGANWPLADVSGMECSKAAQLAVDEINKAGGVLGKQLQLVVVDDEGKGDKGVAAIEKLVTVDKVDILLGGIASGVAAAQIPTMKKYQLVTVATGAAPAPSWRRPWARALIPTGISTCIRGTTTRGPATPRAGTPSRRNTRT